MIIVNPLEQFEVRNIFAIETILFNNLYISITNIGLYLSLATLIIILFNVAIKKIKFFSNIWIISKEILYATILGMVTGQINKNKGQIYFPFIYTLFLFILINNIIGLIPYSFASTSHFILSFSFSFSIVLGATILGLSKHGLNFFSLFVPAGCPLGLLPLLVIIEFISYIARNISLGLRLAANI